MGNVTPLGSLVPTLLNRVLLILEMAKNRKCQSTDALTQLSEPDFFSKRRETYENSLEDLFMGGTQMHQETMQLSGDCVSLSRKLQSRLLLQHQ